AKNYPEQAAALLRWVRAGGNLWVIEAGPAWQLLPEVSAAIEGAKAADKPDEGELPKGWRYAPLGERAIDPAEGALVLSGFKTEGAPPVMKSPNAPPKRVPGMPRTSDAWFAVHGYGLGCVTAFRGTFDSNLGAQAMAALNQALTGVLPGNSDPAAAPSAAMPPS